MESVEHLSMSNVEILNPVARDALMDVYRQADVLFLHLNAYKVFHKVLPSKIFICRHRQANTGGCGWTCS